MWQVIARPVASAVIKEGGQVAAKEGAQAAIKQGGQQMSKADILKGMSSKCETSSQTTQGDENSNDATIASINIFAEMLEDMKQGVKEGFKNGMEAAADPTSTAEKVCKNPISLDKMGKMMKMVRK